jgi:uncharacterized protein (DUF1697 family)
VALLRAVNVGGTGQLPMAKLRAICGEAGFARVETYIASGNVVFDSAASPARVKAELEKRLQVRTGKPVGVLVRTAREMMAVFKANPFPQAEPRHIYAFFLERRPPRDALLQAVGRNDEAMWLGDREIFIHYPSGMGRTKLKIPAVQAGTARNMNTIARLAELAARGSAAG